MKLGIRAHDIGTLPHADLAARAASLGFGSVQLAVVKAVSDMPSEPGTLAGEHAGRMKDAFSAEGVGIAVLGCYINLVDPDEAARRKALDRFKFYLSMAGAFGCRIVGTETGSLNADWSFHPDNLNESTMTRLIESVRELTACAEAHGVCVGIEGVVSHVATTPARLRRVLDAVDSPALRVIFDPINFLNAENCDRQHEIIREAIDLFGDRMSILHLKSFEVADGVLRSVPACSGRLDDAFLVEALKRTAITDILLEDTPTAAIPETRGRAAERYAELISRASE